MLPIAKRPAISWEIIARHLGWPDPAPTHREPEPDATAKPADDLAWLSLCATDNSVDVDRDNCRLALIRRDNTDDAASLEGRFM